MVEQVQVAVIGAGAIGLAIAARLARIGREVVVLEAGEKAGTGISSRNSEVIHAGLYYPPGSLKARLCVTGRQQLYAFCESHQVPHRRCGKLVVATDDEQLPALRALMQRAGQNGAPVQWYDAAQVGELEPAVRCRAALWSPESGIIDSHALLLAMQGEAESAGAVLALASPVTGGHCVGRGIRLQVGSDQPVTLEASVVVNAAGLRAVALADSLQGLPADSIPRQYLAKGSYFEYAGRAPFSHLVYPLPEPGGLGVHLTLDMAGQARFGPDVEWIDEPDYGVAADRAGEFEAAVRHWWPAMPAGRLKPAYAGVRPKLSGPGEAPADFMIQGPADHGMPGLVNLYGIESPGLTASLAIAGHVAELLA